LLIGCYRRREDFERYVPVEFSVSGEVDVTHPAGADVGADFVATEFGT